MNIEAIHRLSHLLQPGLLALVPAVVMFMVSYRIPKSSGRLHRVYSAVFGTLIVATSLGIFGILLCGMTSSRILQQKYLCQTHLKELAQAVALYQQDWDDHLPIATQWGDTISRSLTNADVFQCPTAHSPFGYGFNRALDRLSMEKIPLPAETVLLFEMDALNKNATGAKQEMVSERHSGTTNILYTDGHTKQVNQYLQPKLRWTP